MFSMSESKRRQVLEAARTVFLRYGYKRVTMAEIAREAGMSRPALYLVFEDKAAIFRAVVEAFGQDALEEIEAELERAGSVQAQLELACEVWTLRPYALCHEAPDAQELMDVGHAVAGEVILRMYEQFEDLLVRVFTPHKAALKEAGTTPRVLARVVALVLRGFKEGVRDAKELKQLVRGLIRMTLATLGEVPRSTARAR